MVIKLFIFLSISVPNIINPTFNAYNKYKLQWFEMISLTLSIQQYELHRSPSCEIWLFYNTVYRVIKCVNAISNTHTIVFFFLFILLYKFLIDYLTFAIIQGKKLIVVMFLGHGKTKTNQITQTQ